MDKYIIRKARSAENPYAQILRSALHDPHLSLKAKGLLAYILSLPDDWKLYLGELPHHFTDGRFAVRAALKELKNAEYIKAIQLRNEKGHFTGYEFIVFEDPLNDTEMPLPEKAEPISFDEQYHNQATQDCEAAGLQNTNPKMG